MTSWFYGPAIKFINLLLDSGRKIIILIPTLDNSLMALESQIRPVQQFPAANWWGHKTFSYSIIVDERGVMKGSDWIKISW